MSTKSGAAMSPTTRKCVSTVFRTFGSLWVFFNGLLVSYLK